MPNKRKTPHFFCLTFITLASFTLIILIGCKNDDHQATSIRSSFDSDITFLPLSELNFDDQNFLDFHPQEQSYSLFSLLYYHQNLLNGGNHE